jgi:23S rRNA (adenine1618-N6)-methyltransferase
MWKAKIFTGVGFSNRAVWSRASRRHASNQGAGKSSDDAVEMALGFRITVEEIPGGQGGAKTTIRWLKGHDSVLFESFCGMLKRKIEEVTK